MRWLKRDVMNILPVMAISLAASAAKLKRMQEERRTICRNHEHLVAGGGQILPLCHTTANAYKKLLASSASATLHWFPLYHRHV